MAKKIRKKNKFQKELKKYKIVPMIKEKSKLHEFLDKYKTKATIFSVFIWSLLLILIIAYNQETAEYISREDMIKQIEERCSNEIEIPEQAYNVIFKYNEMNNLTICEVIIK